MPILDRETGSLTPEAIAFINQLLIDPVSSLRSDVALRSQELTQFSVERARQLHLVEIPLREMLEVSHPILHRLEAIYNEVVIPEVAIQKFCAGDLAAINQATKHGGMPSTFHPSPAEMERYQSFQSAYLSPRDELLEQLDQKYPGDFHILLLCDLVNGTNNCDFSHIKGFLTYRSPPQPGAPHSKMEEYVAYMAEKFQLADNQSLKIDADMSYRTGWGLSRFHSIFHNLVELDTIVTLPEIRALGGSVRLVEGMIGLLENHFSDVELKIFSQVFDGFITDNKGDENLRRACGQNVGSANFFGQTLLFDPMATRLTPDERVIRTITGNSGRQEIVDLHPQWQYFYQDLERLRGIIATHQKISALKA